MRLPDAPRVVVLLVATDGARWLPEALDGLRAQDHRPLDVLAVDNASTDGSARLLVDTLGNSRVVQLERRVGYGRALAAALKVAADRGIDADAFLLLHDDAALEPGAITELLRVLAEPDVGIVGCKLLEWDDPQVLLDVGTTIDRYGRTVPSVERGEIDQGQHDGVRAVLGVQSAAMLIAREVAERVGLFDLRYEMLRDDLDLCWRARIAGYRTAITTYARARHAVASARGIRMSPARRAQRYLADRNMIATLIKNYGGLRLSLALPVTVAISLVNTVLFFATGRRGASLQVLRALWWNVRHLPSTLAARHRAQRLRRLPDAEATALMHRGAIRLRQQLSHVLDALVGDNAPEEDLDAPPPSILDRIRAHPAIATALAVGFLGLLAMRPLLFEGPIAGADMAPFPSSGRALLSAFVSGWRGPGEGGSGPATPGLAVLGLLSTLCFGSVWLASRLVLVALPLAGAIGAARVGAALGLGRAGSRLAGLLYGLSPLMLGAMSAGRLYDLAVFAGMPMVVLLLARAARVASPAPPFAALTVIAVTASLGPWLLAAMVPVAVVVALATRRLAVVPVAARMSVIVAALLLPWSIELIRPGSPVAAGGSEPVRRIVDLLAFMPGAATPVPRAVSYGLLGAALVGYLTAPWARRAAVNIAGAVALVGLAGAWAVERQIPLAPRAALPLALTAVGAALLASFGVEAIPPRLAERTFGMAHVVAGIVGLGLVLQTGAGLVWLVGGEREGIERGHSLLPATFDTERERIGDFRVLWVHGERGRPAFALTGSSGETMTSYLARHRGAGAEALRRTVTSIAGGGTTSGGRLLATFGVAYVVLRPDTSPDLAEAFGGQVDLGFVQQVRGAMVLSNDAALPIAAGVRARGWRQAAGGPLDGVAGAESSPQAGKGFSAAGPARYRGRTANALVVLLAEDYSPAWRMHVDGETILPRRSFGWATRFVLPSAVNEPATLRWTGNRRHRALLLIELILVLLFSGAWYQSRLRGES